MVYPICSELVLFKVKISILILISKNFANIFLHIFDYVFILHRSLFEAEEKQKREKQREKWRKSEKGKTKEEIGIERKREEERGRKRKKEEERGRKRKIKTDIGRKR